MRRFLMAGTAAFLALVVGFSLIGYGRVGVTDPKILSLRLLVNDDPASAREAVSSISQRDLVGAADAVLEGLEVEFDLSVTNPIRVPLYVTTVSHQVILNGTPAGEPVISATSWLRPFTRTPLLFTTVLPRAALSDEAVQEAVSGGLLNVRIESRIGLGPLAVTKRTDLFQYRVPDTLRSMLP